MQATLDLPSYLEQDPAVAARFEKLKARPVVLDVQDLGRSFESDHGHCTAFRNVRFQAFRREFLCVIGPSGCGKSTLIRILAGLDDPTEGQALLDGKPIRGPGRDRGMVLQSYTLFPWLTVRRNVAFGLEIAGQSRTSADQEARQWIDLVGLGRFENAYPHQLSGGMKQRVAIARALANRPRILIMDEPFGALDAQSRCQMQSYLLQIWREVEITIVFITHDLDEAIYLADRILVMGANPGRVQEMIEVPVPRPRSSTQFISAPFLATKRRLEELIHPPEPPKPDDLPRIRMTLVDDDVE